MNAPVGVVSRGLRMHTSILLIHTYIHTNIHTYIQVSWVNAPVGVVIGDLECIQVFSELLVPLARALHGRYVYVSMYVCVYV